jgi:hypothetical protein
MTTLLAIAWFLLGVGICLLICWEMDREVTIRDLLVSLIAGFLGPLMIAPYVIYAPKKWLDHKIF